MGVLGVPGSSAGSERSRHSSETSSTSYGAAGELLHVCLLAPSAEARSLADARVRLSDRHRIGVLLQATALMAHLRSLHLDVSRGALARALLEQNGRLCVATRDIERFDATIDRAAQGRLTQQVLSRLLLELFGAHTTVSGRGHARRVARRLLDDWCQSLTEVAPRNALLRIVTLCEFLWEPRYAEHRRALVAGSARSGRVRIIGPRNWRRELLSRGPDQQAAESVAASEDAGKYWQARPRARSAHELFAAGAWRAATRAWQQAPPATAREKYEEAQAYYCLGAFQRALERFQVLDRQWARLYRVACHWHLGELYKAQRLLGPLEKEALGTRETLALADVALRLASFRREEGRQREWISRLLKVARGKWKGRAHFFVAIGYFDMGREDRFKEHLEASGRAGVPQDFGWRLHHTRGLMQLRMGDACAAAGDMRNALAWRRGLRIFEAGRLWNDLGIAREMAGERNGAIKALEHSYRLLSKCEGPVASALCLSNLAEIRIRSGRLTGVSELIDRSQAASLAQDHRLAVCHDRILRARYLAVVGDFDAALEEAKVADELADSERLVVDPVQLASIRAIVLGLRGQAAAAREALAEVRDLGAEALEPWEVPAVWLLAQRRERALERCGADAVGRFWRAVATDAADAELLATAIESLDSFSAARLVVFAKRLAPTCVPQSRLRDAIRCLRRRGASSLADWVEGTLKTNDGEPRRDPVDAAIWERLNRLLAQPPQDEAELRAWFESLPGTGVSFCLRTPSREIVFRRGAEGHCLEEVSGKLGQWLAGGPFGYAVRETIVRVVEMTCDWLCDGRTSTASSVQSAPSFTGIIGESPALQSALRRLERLAHGDLPLLITGETGTGKELAARAAHESSARRSKKFLAINCAALSETLLLSDLFGHAKGAFTGAEKQHQGVFEAANGGTVFLDEIGDLPAVAQGMLLRVLQEGEIRRLGETSSRKVDVRVVAATHRDLENEVAESRFRQDLFYRLNGGAIALPPLRDRGDDVERLADHFLAEMSSRASREDGARQISFSESARRVLRQYPWPGNVRELRTAVHRAVDLRDPAVSHLDFDFELQAEDRSGSEAPWHEWLEDLKTERLRQVLKACSGNQAEAARRLGITRQAMSYLVRQHQLGRTEA